ncbi:MULTISPECIES: carboxylate--amine ligase/circularly permuted type 2 ATP-grasp protein [unclassified Pseudofrankia]|uniref:carboxylate--amine ligase/circularly permuted type 2 ATP-grasp protein n=1 Tax=unclassified Pseudofrankia TaxID=2994372 RepID=UPI0008DA65E7|nr:MULTISPECIES: carboxylate--amine ligase/circularly permuted type 2 ATP-grasp protein [unclassified Pseudofrankia]MDT3442083.1 carboxylate--amine ligase/circularly permuted type 2 ATP-grasp protein [Pseudofrankia sp. BMG5.37]OHV47268.1 carboxylate--amine ligase [Pseudofrankia sp. BMG5.36]
MSGAPIPAVGVEEEFHILDLATRQLVPRAGEILEQLPAGPFAPELLNSVVETNSAPTRDLAALRADLVDLRQRLAAAAEPLGLGPAAAGTVPIVDPTILEINSDPRYLQMTEEYQILAREQVICGAHVHVDVPDRETAMAVIARVAPWLPLLLAVSASSPFWQGADSGYASMRTMVWGRWPTAGVAGTFQTAAEYEHLVADLVKSGVISDPGMVYFDVRPSAHLPTLEMRVCDACPDVDTVVLVAGLFRGLVSHAIETIETGAPFGAPRPELLRAAMWRAARSGLEGDLIELSGVGAGPVPAEDLLARLLQQIRPQLAAAGDWELVGGLAEQAVDRGSAAAAARRAFHRRGLLTDVADLVLARTRQTGPATTASGTPAGVPVAARVPAGAGAGADQAPAAAEGSTGLVRAERVAPTLLAGYLAHPGFHAGGVDEAVDARGPVRSPYRGVLRALERLGPDVLTARCAALVAEQESRGMVFRVAGEAEGRPLPFDLVPRIVEADDWATISAGLVQRVRALEAFLRDVYSDRFAVADGIVPDWIVTASPGLRHWGHAVPAGTIRATVSGIDLVHDQDGRWLVLEDNLRVPSGAGYAVAVRRLTRATLPELSSPSGILGLEGVPALLRTALVAAAPAGAGGRDGLGEPALAVLTSGPHDSAYFEHAFLADRMGVPLVQPADLMVEDDVVSHRVPGGRRRRVDVLYRRIDEDELFAALGADGAPLGPALISALTAGTLSLANAPGNGVADDKVVYAYVPRMINYYLGERPLLDDVQTYLCGDPDQLDHVLRHLDELVVKPTDGYGGAGVLIGPAAEPHELTAARERLLAEPRHWIAQEVVSLSTHPTWPGIDPSDGDGAAPVSATATDVGNRTNGSASRLEPRAVDLRAFVYEGEQTVVAPAALSRVAPSGSLVVNSSRGGGCKDTWLLRA